MNGTRVWGGERGRFWWWRQCPGREHDRAVVYLAMHTCTDVITTVETTTLLYLDCVALFASDDNVQIWAERGPPVNSSMRMDLLARAREQGFSLPGAHALDACQE